jgi:hypothetical protein
MNADHNFRSDELVLVVRFCNYHGGLMILFQRLGEFDLLAGLKNDFVPFGIITHVVGLQFQFQSSLRDISIVAASRPVNEGEWILDFG